MLNLSRRAKRPAVRKKRSSSSSKPSTKSRYSSSSHLTSLPIPSFTEDPELERLEKEFFEDSDSDNEVKAETRKPKAAVIASKLPAPDFVSCLDSDGDDDEDDLLAPSIFAKKSLPAPPTKLPSIASATGTTTTTAAGVELPRSVSTKPIISSPACPYENDDLEDVQDDGMVAPRSASSKGSGKSSSREVDSSQLLQCVDRSFREADIATVTFNKISSVVERELSIKLQPEQRKIVRGRLMTLIQSPIKEKTSEQPLRAVLEPTEQPIRAVLEPAVDAVLNGFSDKGKCTIKEIILALQSQFGAIFTEDTKIIVRKRLIYTLNNPSPPAPSTGVVGNKTEPLASLEPNRQQEAKPETSVDPVTHQSRDHSTITTTKKGKEVLSLAEANKSRKPSKSVAEKAEAVEPNSTVANQKTKGRKPPKEVKDGPIDVTSNTALPSEVIEANSVQETVVPGKDVAPERKKRGRSSRPAVNTAISPANNASDIPPATAPRKAAPTRARKRARGSCSLCANCPCSNDTAECNAFDAMGTAQSDAAQEKDLMKRLLKLEKTAEAREEQADAVRRKLKKHRRDMWRKHEAAMQVDNTGWQEQSRFLPDVKELNKRLDSRGAKAQVSAAAVKTVQSKMFSFAQSFQPTLTQMFSEGKQTETTEDVNLDTFESANLETIEEEPDGEQVVDLDAETASNLSIVMDNEDASMLASDEEDEEDDEGSEGVEVDVHRIEWKGGVETSGQSSPVVFGPSIWRSLMTGGVECTWDRLFDEDLDDESTGIDHLLGMLDDPKNVESVSKSPTVQAASPVQMEMLSQRGQLLAEEILGRIESDNEKVEILEAACPSWKENIIFALLQQESEDVHEALERVKRSKAKLLRVKQEIMESAQRQEAVLNVFEDALRTSLSRVQGLSSNDADADGNEGFFPTQAPESPRRTLFDGEESQDSSPTRTPDLRRQSNITVLTNVEDDLADFTPENDTTQDTAGGIEQETNPSSPPVDPSTPLNCGRESSRANTPHSVASSITTIIASIAS